MTQLAFSDKPGAEEDLIVLSDVHLGHDLSATPGTAPEHRERGIIDEDLVQMLAHYRATRPHRGEGRWRLVINGDFIDFMGITMLPSGAPLETEPSEEELQHGLGSAADHACLKLDRVAVRHASVFRALAELLVDGHAISLVHGNHDVEFYWDAVRAKFRGILAEHAAALGQPLDPAALERRVEFHQWFYYVDGVAYIEHGHQYDTFCATENLMAPLSPLDPRRIARGFTDVLMRFVVKQAKGVSEHGHENATLIDYLKLPFKLGIRGGIDLASRFISAVGELFRVRRQHFSEAAKALKAEHERRMGLLGEATRIGRDRIHALAALQVPPITRSIRGILASVLLDRLALGLASIIALVGLAVGLGAQRGQFWLSALGVLVGWALVHRWLVQSRTVDPAAMMLDRAGHLSRLFPAAFVVMGHTHIPARIPVNEGASTYINLGSWAEAPDAIDHPGGYRAPRTHLVINVGEAGAQGELFAWDSASGPTRFLTPTRG
jgi:UDP-2,3-diacylglucosamine pyrophosphatase LpxH